MVFPLYPKVAVVGKHFCQVIKWNLGEDVVLGHSLIELVSLKLVGNDSCCVLSDLVLFVLQQPHVDHVQFGIVMVQGFNILHSALSELFQTVRVAELYQQSRQFSLICLNECQILENCNLQEVIVWFVLHLQQKSHLFFVFSRLEWDRCSQLKHCAHNYVWTNPAQLQFLQHACHWLEKL